MTELQSLIRLQTWLSPAFPTGAFSYSHGLEAAIHSGHITSKEELFSWLKSLLKSGPGWNDAVLLSESWRLSNNAQSIDKISKLASALSFSRERYLETTSQGAAFLKAVEAWIPLRNLPELPPLPVVVGAACGKLEIDLLQSLAAYLHAYISNQIQAALRLMKLGQQAGVNLLSELENAILETAKLASQSSLDDLGSNTIVADIVAMQHETLPSRIFRS